MQFQIGDQVVHPVHGLGIVKHIKRQTISGGKAQRYYEVLTATLTLWVPADAEHLRLRPISSRSDLSTCRTLLRGDPVLLDKNHRVRQFQISERLRDQSLSARCAIMRDLSAHRRSRPLGANENALLEKIAKAVCDEWAASEGITFAAAQREIEGLLGATPT